jgi:hypothetical protein
MENPMTRKQVTIPGTERPDHPEVEKACLDYCAARDERAEMSKKERTKKVEMFAMLRANNLEAYKFFDPNAKKYRIARIVESDPTVDVVDTDEGVEEVGSGVASGDDVQPAGMEGLINQAMAAQQSDAHVEVSDDGDVGVPEASTPKSKKRGGKKKPNDEATAS